MLYVFHYMLHLWPSHSELVEPYGQHLLWPPEHQFPLTSTSNPKIFLWGKQFYAALSSMWLRRNDPFLTPGLGSNWLRPVSLSVELGWSVFTWSISGQLDAWRLSLGHVEEKFLLYSMETPKGYTMTLVVIFVNMGEPAQVWKWHTYEGRA